MRGNKTEFSLHFFKLAVNYFPCHPRRVSWKELEKITEKTFSCWKMVFHWNPGFVWGHAIFSAILFQEIENQVLVRLCLVCQGTCLFCLQCILYCIIKEEIIWGKLLHLIKVEHFEKHRVGVGGVRFRFHEKFSFSFRSRRKINLGKLKFLVDYNFSF